MFSSFWKEVKGINNVSNPTPPPSQASIPIEDNVVTGKRKQRDQRDQKQPQDNEDTTVNTTTTTINNAENTDTTNTTSNTSNTTTNTTPTTPKLKLKYVSLYKNTSQTKKQKLTKKEREEEEEEEEESEKDAHRYIKQLTNDLKVQIEKVGESGDQEVIPLPIPIRWPYMNKSNLLQYDSRKTLPDSLSDQYIEGLEQQIREIWEKLIIDRDTNGPLKADSVDQLQLTPQLMTVLCMMSTTMVTQLLDSIFYHDELNTDLKVGSKHITMQDVFNSIHDLNIDRVSDIIINSQKIITKLNIPNRENDLSSLLSVYLPSGDWTIEFDKRYGYERFIKGDMKVSFTKALKIEYGDLDNDTLKKMKDDFIKERKELGV